MDATHEESIDDILTLEDALDALRRQAAEIANLRRRLVDDDFTREFRAALNLATAAGTISAPVSHEDLLRMIVDTAAQVISADAASLFLVDESSDELVFEVSLGPRAAEVAKFRVPLGHGIAGLVALTGQAMAVSDAESDPRQASDIAASVGYRPKSLLCVPLLYGDRVTGVLELLDKNGGMPFTPRDVDLLGLFAHLAGVAIEQSRLQQNVSMYLTQIVQSRGLAGEQADALLAAGRDFADHFVVADGSYGQALELARLVQSIVSHGEAASDAARTILRGFLDYLLTTTGVPSGADR